VQRQQLRDLPRPHVGRQHAAARRFPADPLGARPWEPSSNAQGTQRRNANAQGTLYHLGAIRGDSAPAAGDRPRVRPGSPSRPTARGASAVTGSGDLWTLRHAHERPVSPPPAGPASR
jgi:hypothetical protein